MNLSTISEIQKKLWQLVKQLGWINIGLYLVNRLVGYLPIALSFNKYYFVAQLLSGDPLLPKSKGQQLRLVDLQLGAKDLHPCPRPDAVIIDRYKQGAVCLAAYKGEDFAGCLWYIKSRYREDEVRCLYQLDSEQAVWDFDVYVLPKYRLSPVFLKLWDDASTRLLSEGCRWSLSRISAFNAMSLSSHKRMGAKIIGWAVFVRMRGLQVTISSLKPFLHISLSDASCPIFKLTPPNY